MAYATNLIFTCLICIHSSFSEHPLEKEIAQICSDLKRIPVDEHNNTLIKWLARDRVARDEDNQKKARLRSKYQRLCNGLWYETVRSRIEKFEDHFTEDADVEFPKHEDYCKEDRMRIFREKKWNWIFEMKNNNYYVHTLIAKINDSEVVTSTKEFSHFISMAFSQLNEYLQQEFLKPDSSKFMVKFVTTDPEVNEVIQLLMHTDMDLLFEKKHIIIVSKPPK